MPERDLAIDERRVAREIVNEVSSSTTVIQSNAAFIGQIILYASATAPADGWLLCDGTAISRTTYAALFAVIGTTFGAGDGSTTFNLPDLGERVPVGFKDGTNTVGATGGSNTHTHSGGGHTHSFSDSFTTGGPSGTTTFQAGPNTSLPTFNHTHSGSVSGTTGSGSGTTGSADGRPPFVVIPYWIKAEQT